MTLPVAGWYPDPDNTGRLRWWNGMAWTDAYADSHAPQSGTPWAAAPAHSAPATPYRHPTVALTAPAGTAWSTVWIWLIVIMPFLTIFGIFLFDFGGVFRTIMVLPDADPERMIAHSAQLLSSIFSPALLLFFVLSWLVAGLSVVFAYFDWRELKRREVPQPFHWAWAFLQSGVYPIGRSVVARRRIGKGISPMWVTIVGLVMSFVIPLGYVSYMFVTVFNEFEWLRPY